MRASLTTALLCVALVLVGCKTEGEERPIPEDAPPPYRSSMYRDQAPEAGTGERRRPDTQPAAAGEVRRVLLDVRGMTCPIRCVREIKEQIEVVTGVQSIYVDYDAKTAVIRVDAGTDPNTLAAAVRPPYSAHVLETFTN